MIEWARAGVELVKKLHQENRKLYESFGLFRSSMLSLVGKDGRLEFYDGTLRARDADGGIILDGVEPKNYRQYIDEEIKPWSYKRLNAISTARLKPSSSVKRSRSQSAVMPSFFC